METYLHILRDALHGDLSGNRTDTRAYRTTGGMFKHDMRAGFPLITTKHMGMKTIATELEFFIKGYSDKQWLKDRNCNIWNEWCNPLIVPYGHDAETKLKMASENDLGRLYGVQWSKWATYKYIGEDPIHGSIFTQGEPINQLKNIIDTLKSNPTDRRMIVSAWNPSELGEMALPPCHYGFQILSDGINVDLMWSQRSVDMFLGCPYNIASYGLLLELIARSVNMKARMLIGSFADIHIYENHIVQVKEQISRQPYPLPKLVLPNHITDIFTWQYNEFALIDYTSHPKITAPIAI